MTSKPVLNFFLVFLLTAFCSFGAAYSIWENPERFFELRDDSELICYAYTRSDMSGKYVYLGRCMGYGLPYSTQYTCPETAKRYNGTPYTIEQADPNGLYSPEGLSATWLWLIDEKTGEPNVAYIESEITVLQQKLPARLCEEWSIGEDY